MKLLHTAKNWRLGLLLPAALIAATLPAPGRAQQANPIPAVLSLTDSATYADKLVQGRAVQNALAGCVHDIEQNDQSLAKIVEDGNRDSKARIASLNVYRKQLESQNAA